MDGSRALKETLCSGFGEPQLYFKQGGKELQVDPEVEKDEAA